MLLKYKLSILLLAALLIFLPFKASMAQYLPHLNNNQNQQQSNPYLPHLNQQGSQPQQQQQQKAPAPLTAYDQSGALTKEFIEKMVKGTYNSTKYDPDAPKKHELLPISTIPDNPQAYCKTYERNNPTKINPRQEMGDYLARRILPDGQDVRIINKSCMQKVRDVAEQILVDYTSFKKNEMILKFEKNKDKAPLDRMKIAELSRANKNYLRYSRSECSMLYSNKEHTLDGHQDFVESCVIQMLKKRVVQVSNM